MLMLMLMLMLMMMMMMMMMTMLMMMMMMMMMPRGGGMQGKEGSQRTTGCAMTASGAPHRSENGPSPHFSD